MSDREPAARRLAAFAASAAPPAAALDAARLQLLDTLGVALSASALRRRPRIEHAARRLGAGVEATGIGEQIPMGAAGAALLNGMLAHATEADATHVGSVMHGSAVVVPAAFAAAERANADGATLLRAIVVGWEAMIRIGLALPGALLRHGFQATSTAGPFGAALAAGVVERLNEDALAHSLGIAGSQSSGVFEFLADGSNSKWLHGGWPALAGLVAADLAAAGLTGPATILEGSRGFAAAYAREADTRAAFAAACDDLGEAWRITEVAVKLLPTCHFVQPFLECLDDLMAQGARVADIARIDAFVADGAASLICRPEPRMRHPATPYQGKWSLAYCLGLRLAHGAITPASFDGDTPDAAALAWADRFHYQTVPSDFPRCYPGRLRVTLRDGSTRETFVSDVLGGPTRKLSASTVDAKFRAYAAPALGSSGVEAVMKAVHALVRGGDARDLGTSIRAAVASGPQRDQAA